MKNIDGIQKHDLLVDKPVDELIDWMKQNERENREGKRIFMVIIGLCLLVSGITLLAVL